MWKVFPADMSFGELSLIKSQSHLRSHIRIDSLATAEIAADPFCPEHLFKISNVAIGG